ncbi:MAG TPA: hypothetical protein PLU94_03690, partial [Methanoregulaceae archaeon]|nr:hypothetical protein [Methanoregulaceae archaeon]
MRFCASSIDKMAKQESGDLLNEALGEFPGGDEGPGRQGKNRIVSQKAGLSAGNGREDRYLIPFTDRDG